MNCLTSSQVQRQFMGSSSQSSLSVAVLYSFKGSCWAAASRLALIEKVGRKLQTPLFHKWQAHHTYNQGYGPDDCSIKNVDLCMLLSIVTVSLFICSNPLTTCIPVAGANFSPEYLRVNTSGTVPTCAFTFLP